MCTKGTKAIRIHIAQVLGLRTEATCVNMTFQFVPRISRVKKKKNSRNNFTVYFSRFPKPSASR